MNVKGKQHNLVFVIVPEGHESLLGDKASEDLGLVRRIYQINSESVTVDTQYKEPNYTHCDITDIITKYPAVFKRHGTLPYTYRIQLKRDAKPVVYAPQRVPAPLRADLKKELDRMIHLGVIERVEEPTDWVNSITCDRKVDGGLRVCLDPKDLNENIQREHFQIPKREEIISSMAGAKCFSKLDASQGFWQLKLDPESTRYRTFNTPFR